jgi:hypothetical protein
MPVALLFAFLVSTTSHADTWFEPKAKTYSSSFGTYRLTIFPGEKRRDSAETSCEALLEILDGRKYTELWRRPLQNEVAPVDVLVSNQGGRFVTFDNSSSMGYGDTAIVVYNEAGDVVRKLALKDIMSDELLEKQVRTVSSIWWRSDIRLWMIQDSSSQHFEVAEVHVNAGYGPAGSGPDPNGPVIRIRLSDGAIVQ